MHCICDRIALNEALQVLQSIIGTNSTLPILTNVLMEITETKELALTSTNLEVGIQFKLEAEIIEPGICTLPCKKMFEITRELIGDKVEIEISSDNIGIIKCANGVYRLMGMAGDEFPRLPRLSKINSIKINENTLKSLLKKTAYAISSDETRYVLNGVYFIISKGDIVVVATDGRRLAMVSKKEIADPSLEVDIIIPAKTVNELMRVLSGDDPIEMLFSETQVGFQRENMLMVSRLIEGKFPKYEQVIPKSSREKVNLDREEFLSLVRRVALMTNAKSSQLRFRFHDGCLTVTASNPEIGEAKDDMGIEYKGDDFSIAFNPVYMQDALKALDDEKVTLELSEPTLPGVIKVDDTFTYVIMPMKLK